MLSGRFATHSSSPKLWEGGSGAGIDGPGPLPLFESDTAENARDESRATSGPKALLASLRALARPGALIPLALSEILGAL